MTCFDSIFETDPKPILKLIPKNVLDELMEDAGYDPKDRGDKRYMIEEPTDRMERR